MLERLKATMAAPPAQAARPPSAADLSLLAALKATVESPATARAPEPAKAAFSKSAPAGELLPPSTNPPRNERLDTAVNDAITRATKEGVPLPSLTERNALVELARKMRNDGCNSVKEIEDALVAKLREKVTGPSQPRTQAELDDVIDKAYKRVYENPRRPTSEAEKAAFRELAKKLADGGGSAKDILYGVSEQIRQRKDWGGPADSPQALRAAIDKAFQRVFEGTGRVPTRDEYAEYTTLAEELARGGMGSKNIMYALSEKLREKQTTGGAPATSPQVIDDAIDRAFKRVYEDPRRPTSEAEKAAFRDMAKKLAESGASSKDLMYAVSEKVRQNRDWGGPPDSPQAIKAATDKAFQRVFEGTGRVPTQAEYEHFKQKALELAKGGASSKDIMYAISGELRQKQDFGPDPKSPEGLASLVDTAFQKVLEDAYRKPGPREMESWKKVAKELLDGGMSPKDVLIELRTQLRVALYNG